MGDLPLPPVPPPVPPGKRPAPRPGRVPARVPVRAGARMPVRGFEPARSMITSPAVQSVLARRRANVTQRLVAKSFQMQQQTGRGPGEGVNRKKAMGLAEGAAARAAGPMERSRVAQHGRGEPAVTARKVGVAVATAAAGAAAVHAVRRFRPPPPRSGGFGGMFVNLSRQFQRPLPAQKRRRAYVRQQPRSRL